jgi:hypothetical protein
MIRAAATLLALLPTPALACSYIPSELPWEDQLASEPLIFIGTVLMYDDSNALFAVDEPIRGVERRWIEVEQGQNADCRIAFEAGTQWIYAGTFIGGPSMQITTPLDDDELTALNYARSLAD